jgi:hypothetical protein
VASASADSDTVGHIFPSPWRAPGEGSFNRMSTAGAAGYSGTPLAKKLGFKDASRVLVTGAPNGYHALLEPLPAGVRFETRPGPATDIAHVFVTRKDELTKILRVLRKKLRSDAAVWASWPKKSAKVATEISENLIREVALPLGLVDVKVCAVNEVWSGLKLVVRKQLR